jgi:hypothetical protein
LSQNKSKNLGKDQRRHPYNLIKHSISFKNFEIHIFANTNFPRKKSDMLQQEQAQGRVMIEEEGWPRQGPSDGWSK